MAIVTDLNFFTAKDIARFWKKVDSSAGVNGCWLWKAGRSKEGYGTFGVKGKGLKAHRVSWMIHNGSIPNNLLVLHRCDNPPCCNPAHLWLGTDADNSADKVAKNRHRKGETMGLAKLTEEQVIEIRMLAGSVSAVKLSKKYGVCSRVISNIIARKTWKHVGLDIPVVKYRNFSPDILEETVKAMRLAAASKSVKEIASDFGVKYLIAYNIVNNKTYKHII